MSEPAAFKPLDELLERLVVEENGLPGAIVIALDRQGRYSPPLVLNLGHLIVRAGKTVYEKYVGKTSLQPGAPPMSTKSVFWLASCTKLVTAVAAMQCVERGLLKLDDPVGSILPEYAHPKFLIGFTGDNKPILRPAKQSITLRSVTGTPSIQFEMKH